MTDEPIKTNPIPPWPAGTTIQKIPESISLRDWFAGMALQGILASPSPYDVTQDRPYVEAAYILADSMLVERDK